MTGLIIFALAVLLVALAIHEIRKYIRICREDEECRVEVEEFEEAWNWPSRWKWSPPNPKRPVVFPAGKHRIG